MGPLAICSDCAVEHRPPRGWGWPEKPRCPACEAATASLARDERLAESFAVVRAAYEHAAGVRTLGDGHLLGYTMSFVRQHEHLAGLPRGEFEALVASLATHAEAVLRERRDDELVAELARLVARLERHAPARRVSIVARLALVVRQHLGGPRAAETETRS